jgi:hypothetical protein
VLPDPVIVSVPTAFPSTACRLVAVVANVTFGNGVFVCSIVAVAAGDATKHKNELAVLNAVSAISFPDFTAKRDLYASRTQPIDWTCPAITCNSCEFVEKA